MIDFHIGHGRAESGGSAVDTNLIALFYPVPGYKYLSERVDLVR